MQRERERERERKRERERERKYRIKRRKERKSMLIERVEEIPISQFFPSWSSNAMDSSAEWVSFYLLWKKSSPEYLTAGEWQLLINTTVPFAYQLFWPAALTSLHLPDLHPDEKNTNGKLRYPQQLPCFGPGNQWFVRDATCISVENEDYAAIRGDSQK